MGGLTGWKGFQFRRFQLREYRMPCGGEIIPATFEHESGHMLSNAAFGFFQATSVFEGNGLDSFRGHYRK